MRTFTLMNNEFLIILPYFNRPNMLREVLKTFNHMTYSNWHVALIDDGSDDDKKAQPILEELLDESRYTLYDSKDTIEGKRKRGHSLHAKYMNIALRESTADYALIISDDDGIHEHYLSDLDAYYKSNYDVFYSYCHIIPYDPMTELPNEETLARRKAEIRTTGKWRDFPSDSWIKVNHTAPVPPVDVLDSTQVSWHIKAALDRECLFNETYTANNDRDIFVKLYKHFGICNFNGCVGPYKGYHKNQLGVRLRSADLDIFEVVDKNA